MARKELMSDADYHGFGEPCKYKDCLECKDIYCIWHKNDEGEEEWQKQESITE